MTWRASCCPPPGGSYGSVRFYAATGLVMVLSLSSTLYLVFSMSGGMDMPGGWHMSMMWMRMPGQSWVQSAGMFLYMWLSMMVAMMTPSVMPKLHQFHSSLVWRRADHPGLSTALVASGYFTVWTAIGVGVYALGIPWALAAMRWSALSRAVPFLTGFVLVLAGAFQFSSWKSLGLSRCRDLLVYAPYRRQRKDLPVKILKQSNRSTCFQEGIRQGLSCALCCAGSMAVLVALGAMNWLVMLAVAAVIALEKLLPQPRPMVYLTGVLSATAGVFLTVRQLF
jgi:predicted metal-binding membrane protein